MKVIKPSRARVTYYDAKGKVVEVREHPVKDMGTYSVVDASEPPSGAAFQSSRVVIDPADLDHLGPANAEQRAETRESWRTWFWGGVRMYLTAAAVVATFGTVGVICMLLGAFNSEVVLETFSEVLR